MGLNCQIERVNSSKARWFAQRNGLFATIISLGKLAVENLIIFVILISIMARTYLEAGFFIKIATAALFVAGTAKIGMAAADQADILMANADKISAAVASQQETPEQAATRTARITKDNKDTQDNGIPGAILLLAGGAALVGNRVMSNPSNPYDRRANRGIR